MQMQTTTLLLATLIHCRTCRLLLLVRMLVAGPQLYFKDAANFANSSFKPPESSDAFAAWFSE